MHLNSENYKGFGIVDLFEYQQEEIEEDLKFMKDLYKCHKLIEYEHRSIPNQSARMNASQISFTEPPQPTDRSVISSNKMQLLSKPTSTRNNGASTHADGSNRSNGPRSSVSMYPNQLEMKYKALPDHKEQQKSKYYEMEKFSKVKVIKIKKLQSYICLKKAEELLLSKESQQLDPKTKSELIQITLNNLGCFYKKLNYNEVAKQHFELVLLLEHQLEVPIN